MILWICTCGDFIPWYHQDLAGLYPEQVSYRLTGMGAQKNVPKKQKVYLLKLTCLFVKRKFNEIHKLTTPTKTNLERGFSVFNPSFN